MFGAALRPSPNPESPPFTENNFPPCRFFLPLFVPLLIKFPLVFFSNLDPPHGKAANLKICVLGSGSSGNATLLASERTRILLDAGLSGREICRRLAEIGEATERLDAIVVSHEHSDHVTSLRKMASDYKLPVYITPATREALPWKNEKGKKELRWEEIAAGTSFTIGDIEITPFRIPHDAVDPVAFTFRLEGIKVGVATDLGFVPDLVKHHLTGCRVLVFESNHDPEMLKASPYPWSVKQRVLSRQGHLSNFSAGQFLRQDYDGQAEVLILAHLSQINNMPLLARMEAEEALLARNGTSRTNLIVAQQDQPTEVVRL